MLIYVVYYVILILNQSPQIESNKISLMESHRPFAMEESSNLSLMSKLTSRVAILGVSSYLKVKFLFSCQFLLF